VSRTFKIDQSETIDIGRFKTTIRPDEIDPRRLVERRLLARGLDSPNFVSREKYGVLDELARFVGDASRGANAVEEQNIRGVVAI
jgi:hypothetical protein